MELTTFLKACEYNDTETVSHMLKSGFDVNSTNHKGRTGLMTACLFDGAEVVSILVEGDHLDVNAQDYEGHGAIHFMIYSEDESGIPSEKRVTIARLLVETAGANVNLNTADDYWPIEEVIETYNGWESQPQIITILVEAGCKITFAIATSDKVRPILERHWRQREAVKEILLSNGWSESLVEDDLLPYLFSEPRDLDDPWRFANHIS